MDTAKIIRLVAVLFAIAAAFFRIIPYTAEIMILLGLAMVAYAGYFSYLTVTRYAAFEARALDMGNLNQAVWNTAHGRWFHLTNQPGTVNRLSLHVEPILIPIARAQPSGHLPKGWPVFDSRETHRVGPGDLP